MQPIEWNKKIAYRGGLVTSAKRTVFHMTMMTMAIIAVRLTEIKHAIMDGTERTARCFVFLKMMTSGAIILVTSMAAKSVLMGIALQTVWTASWVGMVQIVLYPAWRMTRTAFSKKATFIVLTMELSNASSGGMAPSVSSTVSLMMTTSTGITRARPLMEVKCADLAGKGQAVSIEKRTELVPLTDNS